MVVNVTPEEVNDLIHSEEDVVVIDVLTREYFRKQHLPGAINVEMPDVADIVPKILPKDAKIVLYCYDEDCQASPKAAKALEEAGFTNIHDLEVGIEGYKEAGFPVATRED